MLYKSENWCEKFGHSHHEWLCSDTWVAIYTNPLSSGAIYHNQKLSVQNIQVTASFLARDDWRFLQLKWQMRWRQVTSAVAN